MAKFDFAAEVRKLAQPAAEGMGLSVWDVLYVKEGPSWHLRVVIDKPGGVNIDDCEQLSRLLDPQIDELSLTDREYFFEVSSPGLGRELREDAQLAAYIGKPVLIKLYAPLNGSRELSGELAGFDSHTITLADGQAIEREKTAVIKADDDRDI